MNYNEKLDELCSAMSADAFLNDTGSTHVLEQDISDCPDLTIMVGFWEFETCEDCMNDLAYEMAIAELNEYAS